MDFKSCLANISLRGIQLRFLLFRELIVLFQFLLHRVKECLRGTEMVAYLDEAKAGDGLITTCPTFWSSKVRYPRPYNQLSPKPAVKRHFRHGHSS